MYKIGQTLTPEQTAALLGPSDSTVPNTSTTSLNTGSLKVGSTLTPEQATALDTTPEPQAPVQQKGDWIHQAATIGNDILPGTKNIGESIVDAGTNLANLATGGISKFNKELPNNTVDVPALAGAYGNQAATIGATVISGDGSLATQTAKNAAIGYAGDVSNSLVNGKGSAMPGAQTAIGAGSTLGTALLGAIGKQTLAKLSGTGTDVLQHALENPDTVGQAIKDYATTPEAKDSLVQKAQGAISQFLHDRSVEYGSALDALPAIKTGKTDVMQSFADNVSNFGGAIKNGQVVFKDTTLTKADQNNIKQVYSVINGWKDTSPKGLDGLRQAIGNHMADFKAAGNPRSSVVLGTVQNDLTDSLKKIPGYSDMLKSYGDKTNAAKNLLKELQLGGSAKPSTQLNNVMRIFKKDPSVKTGLVKIMGAQGANDFLSQVSGAILSDWVPQAGLVSSLKGLAEGGGIVGGLVAGMPHVALGSAVAAAASSPRVAGTAATLTGKAAKLGIDTALQRAASLKGGQAIQNSDN